VQTSTETRPATRPTIELERCIEFLNSIGIECIFTTLEKNESFLPGLRIKGGSIEIDLNHLENPGDILHEAGHIAVVAASERATLNSESLSKREWREAEEMMALAWSYAACVHLQLPPHFVFHEQGYRGSAKTLAAGFMQGSYIGLPMLQWLGLAADEKNAPLLGVEPFPAMIKWVRD